MQTMVSPFMSDIRYTKRNVFHAETEIRKILVHKFPDFKESNDHLRYQSIDSDSYCAIYLDHVVYTESTPVYDFKESSQKHLENLLNILGAENEILNIAIRFKLGWRFESIQEATKIIEKGFLTIPQYLSNSITSVNLSLSCNFDDYTLALEFQPVEHDEITLIGSTVNEVVILTADCMLQKEGSLHFSDYMFLLDKIDLTVENQIIPMMERAFKNE